MNISGWILESVVVREFWLDGRFDADCVTFIRGVGGAVAKVFLDDEDYTWKVEETEENPGPNDVEGDGNFKYLHRDLGRQHGLIGARIDGWTEDDRRDSAVACVLLAVGRSIVFEYGYKDETTTISVRPEVNGRVHR